MALSQLFWDVLMPWNLKSTYFSLKMIHFLSLNIWYVIYVVFWIKYWNLKLPHHCILFLFTICTVSQLFWNRVCIIKKRIYCSRKVFCSFTQARTDWQLPLAEPLPITCIDQSIWHGRLWVTSPPKTNTPPSIVPPLTMIGSFPWRHRKFKCKRNCDSIWVLAGYMQDAEKVKRQMW